MTAPEEPRQNPAQLKDDIDSGRTGDKVGGFDPAAAPLGTDAEAAGAGPSSEQVEQARAKETSGRRDSARENAAEPRLAPNARAAPGIGVMPAVLGAGAGLLLGLGLLLLL